MADFRLHPLLNGFAQTIRFTSAQQSHRNNTSSRGGRKWTVFHCALALLVIFSLAAESAPTRGLSKFCKATPDQLTGPDALRVRERLRKIYNIQPTAGSKLSPSIPELQKQLCTPGTNNSL
jgi:hypothetical protein